MMSVDAPSHPVVILGGGCAGLMAALRLTEQGYPVVLLEQDDHVGGLAGGIRWNGNVYEYGPHIFHSTDPTIIRTVKALMGDDLLEYKRTIKIKFLDQYFKFPLSMTDVLLKLPPWTVLRAGISFAYHFLRRLVVAPKVETSETILKRYYGQVLYDIFFKSYIERVWGLSPAEMSPAFAQQRIPRISALEFVNAMGQKLSRFISVRKTSTSHYVEKVEGPLYTTRQGFSLITERMAKRIREQGGRIELLSRVQRLQREGDALTIVHYEKDGIHHALPCSAVINTLPLNNALNMVDPPFQDPAIQKAAAAVRFRGVVFVGLRVKRSPVLPSSFMYFREHSFNRISDLSYFSFDVTPAGSTLLVAEVTCSVHDREWRDDAYVTDAVLGDLVAEGLVSRDEIAESHVFRAEHAYPIYTLHYEKHIQVLLEAVASLRNMETAGRQGRFQYVNTHIVMKMASEAVDRLIQRAGFSGSTKTSPVAT